MKHLLKHLLVGALLCQAPSAFCKDIRGKVTCEGKPVAGVVVTDGIDCVQTNAKGVYVLEKKRDIRHISVSVPAGYLMEVKEKTLPQFFQKYDPTADKDYNFELQKNPLDDENHLFTVQTDMQATSAKDVESYVPFLKDMNDFLAPYRGKKEIFGFDCGDIVGDSPQFYPLYKEKVAVLDMPIYRAIGNHDMTYGGRTFEYSFSKFEETFNPVYYSFNKGKVHYIVLDNCFYVNRDYQYIGYIDERTYRWLEQDLSFVPKGSPVFVVMHIPSSLSKKLVWNKLCADETNNIAPLFEMLKGYNAHCISGHTHYNVNVCFNDSLMEHNTAAVCGIWWKSDICMDGTPSGYGVYEVNGNDVKWFYKSAGYPVDYQFRAYPVGASAEHPTDIIVNVWNHDEKWKVEWYEDGRLMGNMTQYTGYDPDAKVVCDDKERVVYEWITPMATVHMFHATPKNPSAKIEVKVTDRFGREYRQIVKTNE
ncbi:MAG: calcineurin-like phosphoesterase C-terminal domain-containing protein [Bacteroides sp.]|nr:calcineurin-like phosphoesterase C-terminal domain-containing protein [Bacteroides sp.]